MKNSLKTTLIALAAAIAGLAVGYFVFSKNTPAEGHVHEQAAADSGGETIYTCSMHPQIRQNEPGDCPICGMDLIPAGDVGNSDPAVFEMTEQAMKLANVQTTVVGVGSGQSGRVISLNGKVKADERLAASQVAHVPGRIEQLFVTFTGEQVRKGQRLATIYSPELITAQRELLEAVKFTDVSPKLAEAARQKLRLWKIPESTISDIEASGKVRETFTVFADAGGVVMERKVAVGDYVMRGEVLLELMSLNRVWVLFDAYEDDLANIRVGDQIEFSTPAVPNRVFQTKITYIDPLLDAKTRATAVRAEVQNPGGVLKPEMFVRGTLQARATGKTALTVPRSAVLWTGERSVIWVKMTDREVPSFEYREVQLGDAVGDSYLIASGLETGDEVVTNGAFAIDAAAQLNNQQSMMNRAVRVKQSGPVPPPDFTADAPEAFKKQLETLAASYLPLKDALVGTDPAKAAKEVGVFLEKLTNVDMALVQGEAHEFWMEQLSGMQSHGKNIQSGTDVEEQRQQFDFLSQLLITSLQAFGTSGEKYFVQYCPMAFDNKGAAWLSAQEQILNPYFGDKMLKCGTVKATIGE